VAAQQLSTGRSQQKERTRQAILAAAREAITDGGEMTMPAVARRARVSEATAYRYFPDLASLLREVLAAVWPDVNTAMAPMAGVTDPVERIGFATELLLRDVLAHQNAVRATMAASITRPGAELRAGLRFGLIEEALRPLREEGFETRHPAEFEQVRRGLVVVVSAEALFNLTDLYGLDAETAISSTVATARTLVGGLVGA
jgi:AcrR family transcriptional regulator